MKKTIFVALLLLAISQVKGQVSDISINITPTAGYTWWDNQLYIEDGAMVGGMVGFGFGRFLELRGIYEQSLDLKSTLNNLNVPGDIVDKFKSRTVDVTRWGGEFKANIPTGGWLAPYFTLGTGVQKLKLDELKQEQIYLSGGLGTKFNLGDRVTLNFEGKLHAFNVDPSSILRVTDPTGDAFNDWIDSNISDERMMNWSLNVGLQFYLGGRNQSNYTDLDRAYDKKFSNGFSGLRFVLEPGGAYINFDNETNLRSTYLLGGAAGFDFNDFVGLRGFYYRSTKDEKISTDFDNLAMYGADFIAKLNVARGIVPYLTIGGGYMNVFNSYVGKTPLLATNSGYFAKGGLGLSIPIARYFEIFGGANLMFTTDKKDPADLQSTEDLKKHIMYNAGLKFNLGMAANPNRVLDSYVDRRVDDRTMMYEQRINELKEQLDQAYDENDSVKASRIINEKRRLETEMVASSEKQRVGSVNTYSTDESLIRLTPAELESLVDKVVKGVGTPTLKEESPEERLDRLERIIMGGNVAPYSQQPASLQPQAASMQNPEIYAPQSINNSNDELMKELQRISTRIEDNSRKIDNAYRQQTGSDKTFIVNPGGNQTPMGTPPMGRDNIVVSSDGTRQNVMTQRNSQDRATSWVLYKGISPFLGFNFGEATSALFGIKANYGLSNSDFLFTPDLYFGIGGEVAYGLNANVTYPLISNNISMFTPYVGLGLGLNKINDFNFGVNIIGGTYIEVGNGSMFVEYTSRRFFKNNQLSVGYKFDF
ncbi:MAG: hypothetical protein ACOH2V_06355 [Candidatus Saccharimonadaceae bacterium]